MADRRSIEPRDGPSLEQYVETRFNLLVKSLDKLETDILERIEAQKKLTESYTSRLELLFKQTQESAQRAVDKAENQQHAHNVAANEWRSTLNDFKSTLVNKSEFDKFFQDFAAYRLEQSRLQSLQAGERAGAKDTKDESKGMWGMVIAIASAAFVVFSAFYKPTVTQPVPNVVVNVPENGKAKQ